MTDTDRRRLLRGLLAGSGVALLAGCEKLNGTESFRALLVKADAPTEAALTALTPDDALAAEFTEADLSPVFKANGSIDPRTPEYLALKADGFAGFRLAIGGLVANPLALSLADLRARPARTQITRHDCVEGWSCIGQWTGVPLAHVLEQAGVQPRARYVVFRCADTLEPTLDGTGQYYESIGFEDAYHPQTILAYEMNGRPLPIPHGAPLRLRVERQLGYKMAKYIMRIELVESFAGISRGRGGYWEDRGYEWYAGI
jgi:DMSO/TMAO reductase YedYZ molybdopterin-dependent catalytic subunit